MMLVQTTIGIRGHCLSLLTNFQKNQLGGESCKAKKNSIQKQNKPSNHK